MWGTMWGTSCPSGALPSKEKNVTFDEIKQAAYTQQDLSDLTAYHESCAYWTMYYLYACFRSGFITRERAEAQSKKLRRQFDMLSAEYKQESANCKRLSEFWKNTEIASSTYALDRTLENADRLWAVIRNLPADTKPSTAIKNI